MAAAAATQRELDNPYTQTWLEPLDGVSKALGGVVSGQNPFENGTYRQDAPTFSEALIERGVNPGLALAMDIVLTPDPMGVGKITDLVPLMSAAMFGLGGLKGLMRNSLSIDELTAFSRNLGDVVAQHPEIGPQELRNISADYRDRAGMLMRGELQVPAGQDPMAALSELHSASLRAEDMASGMEYGASRPLASFESLGMEDLYKAGRDGQVIDFSDINTRATAVGIANRMLRHAINEEAYKAMSATYPGSDNLINALTAVSAMPNSKGRDASHLLDVIRSTGMEGISPEAMKDFNDTLSLMAGALGVEARTSGYMSQAQRILRQMDTRPDVAAEDALNSRAAVDGYLARLAELDMNSNPYGGEIAADVAELGRVWSEIDSRTASHQMFSGAIQDLPMEARIPSADERGLWLNATSTYLQGKMGLTADELAEMATMEPDHLVHMASTTLGLTESEAAYLVNFMADPFYSGTPPGARPRPGWGALPGELREVSRDIAKNLGMTEEQLSDWARTEVEAGRGEEVKRIIGERMGEEYADDTYIDYLAQQTVSAEGLEDSPLNDADWAGLVEQSNPAELIRIQDEINAGRAKGLQFMLDSRPSLSPAMREMMTSYINRQISYGEIKKFLALQNEVPLADAEGILWELHRISTSGKFDDVEMPKFDGEDLRYYRENFGGDGPD